MDSIESKVFALVSKVLKLPQDKVSVELGPEDVEAWDSLKHMALLVSAEEEFDRQFSDEEMISVGTVGDLVALLKKA